MVQSYDEFFGELMLLAPELWRESGNLEFKAAQGRDGRGEVPDSMWETYSSMANTNGGYVLLGVKELKEGGVDVLGVVDVDRVTKNLWNQVNDSSKVSVNLLSEPDIRTVPYGIRSVIVVHVPRASRFDRPVYVNGDMIRGTYRRQNDGDYHCPADVVTRMVADRECDSRDERVLGNYTSDDVDAESLAAYRQMFKTHNPVHPYVALPDEDFLRQLGCIRTDRENKVTGLSLAGLLMFGKLRSILECCPNYVVDYREYGHPGENERWIDRLTTDYSWSGNVFGFCFKVLQKLYADLKIPFVLEEGVRVDDSPVHVALREALVNTLIHADYAARLPIRVFKRPDGYEFVNPGTMRIPGSRVLKGGLENSDCRNRTLQKLFQLIGWAEQAGSGFPKIIGGWRSQDWRRPQIIEDFELEQTILSLDKITLYPSEVIATLKARFGRNFDSLENLERLIVATAEVERSINHSRIMDLTDSHPSDVSAALQNLVKNGFLCATGIRRGKTYSPVDDLSSQFTDKVPVNEDKSEDKSEVLSDKFLKIKSIIEKEPKLTIPQLADKLQIKVSTMRSIILRLERTKGLVHVGSRKTGHWAFVAIEGEAK